MNLAIMVADCVSALVCLHLGRPLGTRGLVLKNGARLARSEKCKSFPQDKTVAFIFPPLLTGRKESAEQAKREVSKEAYHSFPMLQY